jgi:hypothetical protein
MGKIPEVGAHYRGVIYPEIKLVIKEVDFWRNLVAATVTASSRPNDIGQTLAYVLSTFHNYYEEETPLSPLPNRYDEKDLR